MLQIHDIRHSRNFQEAKEEGHKEGFEEATTRAILKMAAKGIAAEQIANTLDLDLELVRQAIAGGNHS